MRNLPDVLVLGGGVIGLTAAYELAARSARVSVIDRGDFGREASWAGAGIVPPGRPEGVTDPYERLRALSSTLFPGLSAALRERTGIDNGFRQCGGVEFPADEPIDTELWSREGVTWEAGDAAQVQHWEPALAASRGPAYFLPEMAQVRNPRHLQALLTALASQGVTLRPGVPACAFECAGDRVRAVQTAQGRMEAEQFLVCAGAWTDPLLAPFGVRLGVRPVRGQIVLLRNRVPVLRRIVLVGKQYLVPRDDGRVLVGSTEEDAGFDKATTATAIAGLLSFAVRTVPALADATVERAWAGLRPGSPDGLPFIGQVPGFRNLWVAAGHFRAGIQLSPATGRVLAEALTGQPPIIPLGPFRLDRPPALARKTAFRS